MSQPVLRLMRFLPTEERVDVLSWHVTQRYLVESTNYVKERGAHQFSIAWPVRP